jgi:hypothetical protein
MRRAHFLLIGEAVESKRRQRSEENQRRVQENQSRLGSERIV